MATTFSDKTGKKYGSWTALEFVGRAKHGQARWLCQCACGTQRVVLGTSLVAGVSKSCGCKTAELRALKRTKHGMAGTATYKSWHGMLQRVQGKGGHDSYPRRNIGVCLEWLEFSTFLRDMGERPTGTTLDRVDNKAGYSPSNCRWATPKEQSNNRDCNRMVTLDGVPTTLTLACRSTGIDVNTARGRLRKGWSEEAAIKTPSKRRRKELS